MTLHHRDDRQPELLAPLAFPLRGSALIEASAGTGKTFTIAALYLRLVLGHGGEAAFHRPLTPPEILVVTFTEAATKELRDRIRARLAEAATAFLEPDEPADGLLRDLRASYDASAWPVCAQRLRVAAEWMDEAAVSTIHGWCHRMLREHAFDSGSLFEQALQADQVDLQEEAVRDYWRTFFYPLPPEDAATVAGWWSGPTALRLALRNLLPHVGRLDGATPCAEVLETTRQTREHTLAELRAPWSGWCDELQALLDAAVQAKRVDGRKLQARYYHGWLQSLRDWCAGTTDELPDAKATLWTRLTPAGLREAWKSGEPFAHPALDAMPGLRDAVAAIPDGRDRVLAHAACWVAARIEAEQHRRAEMGFDDLLTRLHAALHRAGNDRLAELIRGQFPVALIDEFQDTDPVQYGIFERVYRPGSADEDATALVLIGDPKQAIYAFRGADIFTYLQARRAAARLATLGTNYRSSTSMVAAVNALFAQAEQRPQGQGAFLFRGAQGNPLPFLPVEARGRDEDWVVDGAAPPALTAWWIDDGTPVREGEHRQRLGTACAAEVVRLLQLGQQGRAGFRHRVTGFLRPLQPGDFAILVNNRIEADAVRALLRDAGVRSVYLSEQANVFATEVAGELQHLLQACAAPDDGRLVRAALGTRLLALDWGTLDRLNHDELFWEERLEQFRALRACWQRQGVLPMLRRLLHDFGVPARLIAEGDERTLTDLLHLAELLQQASAQVEGEHALVRFLAEQRTDPASGQDSRQLRLESDAELLKVVTVHKSKGLEYPLVFVPYACACRPVREDDLPMAFHDDDGRLHVSLRPEAAMVARADRERLGEDLRKLYVALTRARFATWVGIAPTTEVQRTAMGYLLGGEAAVAPGTVASAVQSALGGCHAVGIAPAPAAAGPRYAAVQAAAPFAPPPPLPQRRLEHWWIASYSRLRRADQAPAAPVAPATAQEETWIEAASARDTQPGLAAEAAADAAAAPGTLHGFPRGPAAGSFLHGLLEWAGRQGFGQVDVHGAEFTQLLARRCQAQRWEAHQPALQAWMADWLARPLDLRRLDAAAAPVAPRALRATQSEMEFWLATTDVDARALDDAVCAHTLDGVARARLEPDRLNGMLKGFIDLVFEHGGRYYVADYKSNWLGPGDADYTAAAMRDEVLHHRYELQYALYLFALHRLLRSRLPDYDYDRHVGGAVYVFLRGHAAPGQGLHLERPPRALMDALDGLFSTGEVPA